VIWDGIIAENNEQREPALSTGAELAYSNQGYVIQKIKHWTPTDYITLENYL